MFSFNTIDEYQIEITSKCNASCPQCPRNINGGEVNPYLPVVDLPRNVIDRAFPTELCMRLRQVFFCGSYGDPIAHPEFLDILRDFRSKNPTLWLYIHTNGGIRSADYWTEMAQIINGYGKIDFGIDGLQDTLHLYRKDVDYNKVIRNATAFIKAGGKAQWNFIVFAHNEHQVQEAEQLSKDIGFETFLARKTGRFMDHTNLVQFNNWPVKSRNGDYIISPPRNAEYRNSSMSRLSSIAADYFETTEIRCDALKGNKVAITATGLVMPCNFFTHNLYDARFRDPTIMPGANSRSFVGHKNQVREFIERYDINSLNLYNNTLESIFANNFWTDLVDSFTNGNRLFECAMTCGSTITKVWDQNK